MGLAGARWRHDGPLQRAISPEHQYAAIARISDQNVINLRRIRPVLKRHVVQQQMRSLKSVTDGTGHKCFTQVLSIEQKSAKNDAGPEGQQTDYE